MAEGVKRLSAAAGRVKGNTTSAVVYRPARDDGTTALSPGTEALSLRGLLDLLARRR
jgi:hypothetical protein